MIRNRTLPIVATVGALIALAACSSPSHTAAGSKATSVSPAATSTVTASPSSSAALNTAPVPSRPNTTISPPTGETEAATPMCASIVGRPAAVYVDPTKGPQCAFGTLEPAGLIAKFSSFQCTPTGGGAAESLYVWFASDPTAPDQAEYAGLANGNIVTVPASQAGKRATQGELAKAASCTA